MRRLSFLAALIAASGCLPTRDNPSDPYNLPDVTVRIHDFTTPGTTECGDPHAAGWPEVTAISRGHCLFAEATETTDPQGDSLDELSFTFYVDTGLGLTRATATTGAIFVLDAPLRESLPFETPISVVAQAKDRDGSKGRGRATLILLNERPLAVSAPAIRSIPGGYPWQGGSIEVEFDGSRSDARDQEVAAQECWTFPDEPAEICGIDDPAFTREIPLTGLTRYASRLVIDDGKRSTPVWTEIRATGPVLWATDPFGGGDLHLVDAPEVVPGSLASELFLVKTSPTERRVLVGWDGDAMLAPYPVPSPIPSSLYDVLGVEIMGAAGGGDGTIFVIGKEFPGGGEVDFYVSRFSASQGEPSGLQPIGTPVPLNSAEDNCQESPPPSVDASPDGRLWIASRLFGDLRVVNADGTIEVITLGEGNPTPGVCSPGDFDDFAYAGVAVRPGTSEAWVGVIPYSGGVENGPRIEVYEGASTTPARMITLPWPPSGIAWANESELWITSTIAGIVRVDIDLVDLGFPFAEAIVASFPDRLGYADIKTDPVTGTAWLTSTTIGQPGIRIFLDGTVTPGFNTGAIAFVGDDGRGWSTESSQISLRDGNGYGVSVVRDLPMAPQRPVALDVVRGWAWAAISLGINPDAPPYALQAVSPDGGTARLVTKLTGLDGNPRGIPAVQLLRISPDGDTLFIVSGDEDEDPYRAALRIDMRTDPPTVVTEQTDLALVERLLGDQTTVSGSGMLGPTTPSGSALWTFDLANDTVFQIDGNTLAAAPISTPFQITAPERTNEFGYGPYAAVLPISNQLCMLTRGDLTTGSWRVRYAATNGTAPLHSTIAFVDNPALGAVSTWADASGAEGCWTAVPTDGSPRTYVVTSFNAAGGIVGSRTYAVDDGVPFSIRAISANEAIVTYNDSLNQFWRRLVDLSDTDEVVFAPESVNLRIPFEASQAPF